MLSSNLSSFDFTQTIAPPALDLQVYVTSEWLTGIPGLLYLVDDPFLLKIDGQAVPGVSFTEDLLDPGNYYLQDVDVSGLSHGAHEIAVHVTDTRGMETDSNSVAIEVVQGTGLCANPFAEDGQPDTDGDGFRDECDNCPTVSNPSQRSTSSGGGSEESLGDACKALARVWVSSDAEDNPDFTTIQEAVDLSSPTAVKVRVEILPGTGPYQENVVVDRGQSFRFVGWDRGAGPPIVEHDGAGETVFDFRSAGVGPIVLHNLVLRGQGVAAGQRGVAAGVGISTHLSDLRFEQLENGAHLRAGDHLVERIAMDGMTGTGVISEDGALSLRFGEFRGVARAVRIAGSSALAEIEHVLVAGTGDGDGIVSDSTPPGAVQLRHSTLVDCGTAVSGSAGATTIAHSILWNNQSDVSGVACLDITWSDLQDVNCGGTNRSEAPLFVSTAAGDYHLQAVSPLLDHGPDPSLYSGIPCTDLDGEPRLRDHDGDNVAQVDPGAYERTNAAATPPEVTGLAWTGRTTLEWIPEPTAVEYHVYRAPLSALAYSAFGTCEDGLDAVRTDTVLTDATVPPIGDGYYYTITVEDSSGAESTLGAGTCAERSNFAPCP